MNDPEIIENYFKARGWEYQRYGGHWRINQAKVWPFGSLPQILTDYPAFKEHVLLPMKEEGLEFEIVGGVAQFYKGSALFFDKSNVTHQEIIDDEILTAAVISATRYWEQKNE